MRQTSREAESKPETKADSALDLDGAWTLLLYLAGRARARTGVSAACGFVRTGGQWQESPRSQARVWIEHGSASFPRVSGAVDGAPSAAVRTMLDLYLPLVSGPGVARMVVGHLGQSLDGRVATPTGCSQFITGREDVVHTHRLRALFDAVLVGVRTVELDDPQLTTRLVPGEHPVRVVLDPRKKLAGDRFKLFEDGVVSTLICTAPEAVPAEPTRGHVTWLGVPTTEGGFDVSALLSALRARGLSRVFVEGGGVTVSRFLSAGAFDRLHVSVAPMILGSGAPAFCLPPIDRLDEALTPRCRHFSLGPDVLFDCELRPLPQVVAE